MNPYLQDILSNVAMQVFFLVLTGLVIPLLGHAIGAVKDARVRSYAALAVQAAQQYIPDKSARYDYAAHLICSRFPYLKEDQVRAHIEASVQSLKAALAASQKAEGPSGFSQAQPPVVQVVTQDPQDVIQAALDRNQAGPP